jgi:hypothetical protein
LQPNHRFGAIVPPIATEIVVLPKGFVAIGGKPCSGRKHPHVEKKEDTVGRETMINCAISSTLMG